MMNYIWAGMLVLGIVFAVINGRLNEFSDGLMVSCTNGVFRNWSCRNNGCMVRNHEYSKRNRIN